MALIPKLFIKEVPEGPIRRNFENLLAYFRSLTTASSSSDDDDSETDPSEIDERLNKLESRFFAAGVPLPFCGSSDPDWGLPMDGKRYRKADYPRLYAAIGYTYGGSGDWFHVPDWRYHFTRGWGGVPDVPFHPSAVDTTSDTIAVHRHPFNRSGFPVRVSSTGSLPGGLSANTTYYVIFVSEGLIQLATSLADAMNGIAIDLTSQGTFTHTITQWADPDARSRVRASANASDGDKAATYQEWATARPNTNFSISPSGAHTHTTRLWHDDFFRDGGSSEAFDNDSSGNSGSSEWPTGAGQGAHTHTVDGGGDNETRPRNAGVKYYITI